MKSLRLLVIAEDAESSQRFQAAFAELGWDVFFVRNAAEAAEALSIKQFDVVLMTDTGSPALASEVATVRKLSAGTTPATTVIGLGSAFAHLITPCIDEKIPFNLLSDEILRLEGMSDFSEGDTAARMPVFDSDLFLEQMAHNRELIAEIVGLFKTETTTQLQDLRHSLDSGNYHRASRIAHSLKGSLASLHAPRAHYWSQLLETAAVQRNSERAEILLQALRQCLDALESKLHELVHG